MRTLVGVNTLTAISAQAYSSHCQEWFRMGKDFPDDDFILYNPHRASIDRMRNQSVAMALEWECDYLYFIDDDMLLAPRTYKKLRDAKKDIIMAHTIIRGYPFDNMMFIDPRDPNFEKNDLEVESLVLYNDYKKPSDDLLRIDAVGCATVLFKMDVFKKLEPPYFVTLPNMTEDVYFCLRHSKQVGRKNTNIYCHLGAPTGHIMEPEIVSPDNRSALMKRVEEDFPEVLRKNVNADRGNEYVKNIEYALNGK